MSSLREARNSRMWGDDEGRLGRVLFAAYFLSEGILGACSAMFTYGVDAIISTAGRMRK